MINLISVRDRLILLNLIAKNNDKCVIKGDILGLNSEID